MAFQELPDMDCETTYALGGFNKKTRKDNPTEAEGYFIGSKQVVSKKSKTGFAALHIFQKPGGENFGVWGKTDLDRKMSVVTPGNLVRVTFTGMKETENNPMYKYKVQVDKEDTIEVGDFTQQSAPPTQDTTPDAGYDDADDGDLDQDDIQPDEITPPQPRAPRQAAKPPTGEAQRRVQELLNKSKNRQAA